MKFMTKHLFLVLPLLFAPLAFSQQQTFTVNPDSSQVTFALGGNTHHVDGSFRVQSGKIDFDPGTHGMAGFVVVAAGSGYSGNESRDKKMETTVLDVAHYAQITFVPRSFTGTLAPSGDSTIQVSGVFTLHGTPHDLTVPMQIHVEGAVLSAKTHFTVPYVKWGLKDPSIFILKVAKVVDIDLTLAGSLSAAK
jgi:polyisoprenoid-binding protein YceI